MRMVHKFILLIFWLAAGYAIIETSLYFLMRVPELVISRAKLPSFTMANVDSHFWVDIDPVTGVWHAPNSEYHHVSACFDVKYQANRHGARDKQRELRSPPEKKRVVVLGDSFTEGYGVRDDQRMSDILEERTGLPHLNFGTSGNFGPTQYLLRYQSLASKFEHDMVLVGLLPANDFHDDDIEFGRKAHADRYRPYFVGEYPDYELVYYKSQLDPKTELTIFERGKATLREFSHSYNALRFAKEAVLQDPALYDRGSMYFDYGNEQLKRLRFVLSLLKDAVGERQLVVFTIPVAYDFEVSTSREPSITAELERYSREIGFQYIDLLGLMKTANTTVDRIYHDCDGHWSPYGNQLAARLLLENVNFYKK